MKVLMRQIHDCRRSAKGHEGIQIGRYPENKVVKCSRRTVIFQEKRVQLDEKLTAESDRSAIQLSLAQTSKKGHTFQSR